MTQQVKKTPSSTPTQPQNSTILNAQGRPFNQGKPFNQTASSSTTKKSEDDIFSTIARWFILIISAIPRMLMALVEQFTERGNPGTTFLAAIVFLFGCMMSADTYWVTIFHNKSLFPWYVPAREWLGWQWAPGVRSWVPFRFDLGAVADPAFYISFAFAVITQAIQTFTLFGEKAKLAAKSGIPAEVIGWIALGTWAFDLVQAFGSRPPLGFSHPGDVFGCTCYDIATMFAAELGRVVSKILRVN